MCLQEDELQATAVELRHRSEELKRQTEALQLQVSGRSWVKDSSHVKDRSQVMVDVNSHFQNTSIYFDPCFLKSLSCHCLVQTLLHNN